MFWTNLSKFRAFHEILNFNLVILTIFWEIFGLFWNCSWPNLALLIFLDQATLSFTLSLSIILSLSVSLFLSLTHSLSFFSLTLLSLHLPHIIPISLSYSFPLYHTIPLFPSYSLPLSSLICSLLLSPTGCQVQKKLSK